MGGKDTWGSLSLMKRGGTEESKLETITLLRVAVVESQHELQLKDLSASVAV